MVRSFVLSLLLFALAPAFLHAEERAAVVDKSIDDVSPLIGKPLPPLLGPAMLTPGIMNLTKLTHEVVFLKDDQGRFIKEGGRMKTRLYTYALVMNFFATYCAPCIREIPTFNKIAAAYSNRAVKFLYVNVDAEKSTDEVKAFALDKGITVEMMFPSPTQTFKEYEPRGPAHYTLPRIVIADSNGKIVQVLFGFQADLSKQLDAVLAGILPPPEKSSG
jgi:thiol-disulfide isomerase/thioredoxin